MVIDRPGVYDMPAADYHADPVIVPSLSASIAKLLVTRTPLHAWTAHPRLNREAQQEEDAKFDIGNAAHSLILHDERAFAIIDAPDYRTKAAQEARFLARAEGKIPLLAEQFARVHEMVAAARNQLEQHREALTAFVHGKPEQTLIWQEGGIWCRARLDWLNEPGDREITDDYKTTQCADPDAFQRIMIAIGHDLQAAFYLRGVKALGLAKNPRFRFIVQECDPPYALAVIAPSPGMLDLADRKVGKALALWHQATTTNDWPGYPEHTCYVDVPQWHEAQYLDREVRDDEQAKKLAIAMQAPQ